MKLLLAISFALFAALLPAPPMRGGMVAAAEQHGDAGRCGHAGFHGPGGDMHLAAASLCRFYCAEAAATAPAKSRSLAIVWRSKALRLSPGVAPHETAPEVPEHPPKTVVV